MRSIAEINHENEELRRRCGEAEEALRAIREGQVDAIVVEGPAGEGPQIFSLSGAETVYRILVETMYEGALTVNGEGKILFCNQRFCDLMRTSTTAALGINLTDFIANEGRPELEAFLKSARGGPVRKRVALKAADETEVPVQLTATMLKTGSVATICIVMSDLTELEDSVRSLQNLRKHHIAMQRVQRELRQSRTAALNLMEDAIAAEEEQRRALRRFELLSQTAGELLRTRAPEKAVYSLCEKVMSFLDCHAFFNFLVDKSAGRLRLNACAGIPEEEKNKIKWLDFGVAVCGCAARDAQRIVAEHIPTTPDLRTELVKSYGIKAYACHPLIGVEGMVLGTLSFGTRSREVFSEEDLAMMKAVTDQVAVAMVRIEYERELQNYREDLERLVEERTVELKESQAQLLHSQKMEALGQMAGGIAHDFNNMMQVVTGFADRTLRSLGETSPLRDNLRHIYEAATSAAALTHHLLAFSRRQFLQPQVLSLNELILKCEPMLKHTLSEDIDISYSLEPGLELVKADPTQIEQVIINMAVNARFAMPKGGKLVFETKNVTIGEEFSHNRDPISTGPYVMLSISDTGCGMDKDIMEKIFEPFFTTRPFGKGSGLGLSTAYGTIRQSGGTIRVKSEVGKGTTFFVYLPRTEEKLLVEEKRQRRTSRGERGQTVLVVEDKELALELIALELTDLGYAALLAHNAEEAISLSRSHMGKIHLLLTDVVLPGESGLDISKILTSQRPDMATLYMSGYDSDHVVRKGELLPGTRLLAKPFSSDQLAAAIEDALSSKRPAGKMCVDATVFPEEGNGERKAINILVVDDDPGVAAIFASVLRRTGRHVASAEDGASALKFAAEVKPDVVLLDIRLPDMDGHELSRQLRQTGGTRPFIIAASGFAPEVSSDRDAFDAYLVKPIDFTHLEELIESVAAKGCAG
jgi:PAS domain S-box-containing protein